MRVSDNVNESEWRVGVGESVSGSETLFCHGDGAE